MTQSPYHDVQTNPYEQEVKVERGLSAAGQRRADYAFYLAPNFRDAYLVPASEKKSVQASSPLCQWTRSEPEAMP